MHEHYMLKSIKFDRIIFNFPHSGHISTLCRERTEKLIRRHKQLLAWFFKSASKMLSGTGEVHVSHRTDYPYNKWELEKLANREGLVLLEMIEFKKSDYPGYHNKRGGEIKSNKTFPLGACFTYKFSLPRSSDNDSVHESSSVGWLSNILESLGSISFSEVK